MTQQHNSPSAAEARELLAKAEGIGTTATSAAGWPTAMVFNSMAIIGSLIMIGFHIVAHTGYGAPLFAAATGIWACITAMTWSFMQRTTKAGYSKRYSSSLAVYMGVYAVALLTGLFVFPNGNLVYFISAAVVIAAVGLAAAFRELRA